MNKITESKFLTELEIELCPGSDGIWSLKNPLVYESKLLNRRITVPHSFPAVKFYTDLASVPRVPIVYEAWGNKAHREAVLHDYLYRIDSNPVATFMQANRVFLEAMIVRGKPFYIAYPMFWGVCAGGWTAYHKLHIADKLGIAEIQEHKEDTVTKNIAEDEKKVVIAP